MALLASARAASRPCLPAVGNVENRLTRADGPGVTAEYLYDPLGRRFRKCVVNTEDIADPCDDAASVITEFLSDGVEEIMDYDGRTGVASMRYFHGSGVDELLAWQDVASGVIQQLASDQLGSVVAQQVRWGAITETWRYSVYGEIVVGEETGQPFRFTGRRYDAETGLYYYRARYYSSILGRFLQTDPIGYGDNMNLYAYVGNDPVNARDPSGRCPACVPVVIEAAPVIAAAVVEAVVDVAILIGIGVAITTNNNDVDAPDDIVGEDPRPSKKPGGRTNSGPLAPDNGGTGNADEDFDILTGGNSGPVEEGSGAPEGTRVGGNGVQIRPGIEENGPRIDIPAQGDKPAETLHYPNVEKVEGK